MTGRKGVYFVSDVHLGLSSPEPSEREDRFVRFLKSIPRDSEALWLLGDIWDFWYEWESVVPKEGVRVVAQLLDLLDAGVKVNFIPGNHDIWTYHFFEDLGIRKFEQPVYIRMGGKRFCLSHGDGIGGAKPGYRIIRWLFHNRVAQRLFSTIHPTLAFRMGKAWSGANRTAHKEYVFVPEREPAYRWAVEQEKTGKIDCFILGHFHSGVRTTLPGGGEFIVLDSWLTSSPYLYFDGRNLSSLSF